MKKFVFKIVVILALLVVVGVLGCPSPVTVTPTTTHGTQAITSVSSAEESYNRGSELLDKGEYDEAIDEFTKAIEIDPNYAEAYNNRGLAYYYTWEYDLAVADYDKAIEIDPDYADAYNNRGNAYADNGQYDLAIADYDRAIEIDPKTLGSTAVAAMSTITLGSMT